MTARRAAVGLGSTLALLGAVHGAVNVRALRVPSPAPPPTDTRVAVLVPARDEEHTIAALLADLRAQQGVRHLTVTVLDDDSGDDTVAAARRAAGADPRIRVVRGTGDPAPGWLGKPAACHRLAHLAPPDAEILVFLDADVRLAPHAVAAAVDLLARSGLDLICPWPAQLAGSAAERLVQPLLQWSWLTTLPLRIAERSPRPALAAANGQFLVVRTGAYHAAGGHAGVAAEVLEDIALLRAVKRTGGTGGPAAGATLARCRMYADAAQLRTGYGKSLWAAFGSAGGAAAALGLLALAYLLPAAAMVAGTGGTRLLGTAGYAAAVASRIVAARATGGRWWPDALAHPLSVAALGALTAESLYRHRRGTLTWKGRTLPARSG
ncbi:MAG TPA: glycosyltransferase family A protein [Pseudonocardiaceae bacterium]